MELEQQVTNKEISQKLQELGVEQESFVTWVQSTECEGYKDGEYKLVPFNEFYGAVHNYWCAGKDNPKWPMYSAFTVAELGEMLPKVCLPRVEKYGMNSETEDCWKATLPAGNEYTLGLIDRTTEADARGKMLIYLLENNLITP